MWLTKYACHILLVNAILSSGKIGLYTGLKMWYRQFKYDFWEYPRLFIKYRECGSFSLSLGLVDRGSCNKFLIRPGGSPPSSLPKPVGIFKLLLSCVGVGALDPNNLGESLRPRRAKPTATNTVIQSARVTQGHSGVSPRFIRWSRRSQVMPMSM